MLPDWDRFVDRESGRVLGSGAPIVVPDVDFRDDEDDRLSAEFADAAARVLDDGGGDELAASVADRRPAPVEGGWVQPLLPDGPPTLRIVRDDPDPEAPVEGEVPFDAGGGDEWDRLSMFDDGDD